MCDVKRLKNFEKYHRWTQMTQINYLHGRCYPMADATPYGYREAASGVYKSGVAGR
jgi:hypothetical protein